jgi:hypothetical protein
MWWEKRRRCWRRRGEKGGCSKIVLMRRGLGWCRGASRMGEGRIACDELELRKAK